MLIDTRQHPAGTEQLPKNVPLHTGSLNQQWLLESDIIVISPGLAVKHLKSDRTFSWRGSNRRY